MRITPFVSGRSIAYSAACIARAIVALAFLGTQAVAESTWQRHDELGQSLAELVDDATVVGLAVGVAGVDGLHFARGFGSSSIDNGNPITEKSVFHWASVSKPFVAVAIMQLVERGDIELEDLLVERLPWLTMADERYRDITIAQLMSHTSGMPDVDDYEWDNPQTDDGALKRWILELNDEDLLFTPGTEREYSNIGFEILGLVIQETAGVPFETYMSQNIFEPLGMQNTSFIATEINAQLTVTGHHGRLWRRAVDAYPYNRRHAPSSTLNTNVADMSRFAAAMLNGGSCGDTTILRPDSIATMWSEYWRSPTEPDRTAALGWNVGRPWGGILSASHGGHDDGFRSFLYLAPEEHIGIFMVANDDTISTRDVMRTVLSSVFPEQAMLESD